MQAWREDSVSFYLDFLENLLRSGGKLAAPLWLAATGETYAERSGVIIIGLEGMMLAGAFAGMAVGFFTGSPWWGVLAGILAGIFLAALFGALTVYLLADQIILHFVTKFFKIFQSHIHRQVII